MNQNIKSRIMQGKQKAINYIDAGGSSSSSCSDGFLKDDNNLNDLSVGSYEALLVDEDPDEEESMHMQIEGEIQRKASFEEQKEEDSMFDRKQLEKSYKNTMHDNFTFHKKGQG